MRHPVEVPAADADHLVQWLSKRVGYQLRAPDLEKLGLKLVGGRLLPGPTGPAAFFMYEAPSGERYTIYCARSQRARHGAALQRHRQGHGGLLGQQRCGLCGERQRRSDAGCNDVAVAAYEQIDGGRTPSKNGGG